MSISFAEKIIDGMVDEDGRCGERGLSRKQFDVLSGWLEPTDWRPTGEFWEGDYTTKFFEEREWEGNIGRYHVVLNQYAHFNDRFSVVSIELRPADEVEREQRLAELAKFEHSEWQFEPKQRVDLVLTLVRDYEYYGASYGYYDSGRRHIYAFADADGNCYVWKTANAIYADDYDGYAEVGDTVSMRATVKEHSEYRGIRQTVITRPKVTAIEHR